jgi:hypothetical protein|tara:strand:- start:920 stop:1174 length:255 start_codon:yes stop_codon:yes gene_type:complete
MSEGSTNPLANMPPWAWAALVLGGGGLGGLQFGGASPVAPTAVVENETCDDAEDRAREALAAWKGMIESYSLILTELGQCRQEQ